MAYFRDESRGNYRNYYKRRRGNNADLPPHRDERVDQLLAFDHDLFRDKTVLDIGCNAGNVSIEIAQQHQARKVYGVDIDIALIHQCRETVEAAYSAQRPVAPARTDGRATKRRKPNGTATKTDDEVSTEAALHHFPACFSALYGPISTVPVVKQESEQARVTNGDSGEIDNFPRNLAFYAADWANEPIETDEKGYDVILALSLTKWIHLHNLDEGIIAFFQRCYDKLHAGGKLVLEKQDWKGYKDAKRGNDKLKDNYFKLKLRPEDDFERILLEDVGFAKKEAVKDQSGKGFDRTLEIYHKA